MADLPVDRLTPSPPFTFVGVDVFGPWNVVTRRTRGGSAANKRWAVLFACLGTRAVHIELIEEMSSSSFINAVRRFYSVRGKVVEFRSDRGSNFVGATADLGVTAINVEDPTIKDFLLKSGTVWKFNPAHASHFGGVWERMIGVARRILDSILMDTNTKSMTHEGLATFMAEVTAILKARPLVPVSSDPESPFVLSPSMILTHKSDSQVESYQHLDTKELYRSLWKQVQILAERFWNQWRREYLQTIQKRQRWTDNVPNLKERDIVILKDTSVCRNDWPIGIITRVFPSDDGLVRKIEVRHGNNSRYVRPVTEVVKLLDDE